jgi:thiol-disulfide isomerase/thioredoxin
MRTILMTVAGRELLEGDAGASGAAATDGGGRVAQRQALAALLRCEALALGAAPDVNAPPLTASRQPYPSLEDERTLLEQITPSFLGVRYGPVTPALAQANPGFPNGTQVQYVEEGSAAAEAGVQIGDVLLGPSDRPFTSARDIRNWTTTAPRDRGLAFRLYRPGKDGQPGGELHTVVHLRPYAGDRIGGGIAPRLGSAAPILPAGMTSGRPADLPDLRGRPHLLFFWATWCGICKAAVPEVMAYAEAHGLPVLAITDEDQTTVSTFLAQTTHPFFEHIGLDASRRSFISHGVSGTPVLVRVDAQGIIRYRQVGYGKDGLRMDGWNWQKP